MGEIVDFFKQKTEQEILKELKNFQNRVTILLNEINLAESIYEKNERLNIREFQNMDKFTSDASQARQNLLQAREKLKLNSLYKEGYQLLNEIGHFFNGSWKYSVTLSYYGEMYTFHMDEEQFLNLGEAHLSGFKLISGKENLLNRLFEMGIQGIKWTTDANSNSKYDQRAYENYTKSIEYAKGIIKKAEKGERIPLTLQTLSIKDYNKGQQLEGFFAFLEAGNSKALLQTISNQVEAAKIKKLGPAYRNFRNNLIDLANQLAEQTNSRGFWTGGDTKEEGQIKGEGASLFQFSTIKNQLNQFLYILNTLHFDQLEQLYNQQISPKVHNSLRKKIIETTENIQEAFNATAINTTKLEGLGSSLDSFLNNILSTL